MSTPNLVDEHSRYAARRLLCDALTDSRPLRPEVREALNRLLDTLSISEDRLYTPDTGEQTVDEQARTDLWHASAWRAAVTVYRLLLTEVREHGATAAEGVAR